MLCLSSEVSNFFLLLGLIIFELFFKTLKAKEKNSKKFYGIYNLGFQNWYN